jgi:hypothetical protein
VYSFFNNQIINNGQTFDWQGTNYSIPGIYHAQYTSIYGCDSSYTLHLTANNPNTVTLTIKLILEGLYAGGGMMNQAQNASGPEFGTGISDKVTIELHNASAPYAISFSFPNQNLFTNGIVTINNIPASISGSYLLVVKHRNSIETWSSNVIDFGITGNISYDFTTGATKAWGSNQKLMPGNVYAIYAGDVMHDGIVDGLDMAAIDNASIAIMNGYFSEDVNGDGIVDGSDIALIENNSTAVVHIIRP